MLEILKIHALETKTTPAKRNSANNLNEPSPGGLLSASYDKHNI